MENRPRERSSARPLASVLNCACAFFLMAAAALGLASPAAASFASFVPTYGGTEESAPALTTGEVPSIQAYPINGEGPVQIDGRLDDPAWKRAESGSSFRVFDPNRGATPSEPTVFKVAYDDDALYFAVACYEEDPSRISKKLSRRDRESDSDMVSVYIDPYGDRTTGYNFRVNPLGVQQDIYIYDDGEMDSDWDAVWQAETYQDREGWYAEFRIPFSSIRYRPDLSSWGLQVYRYMHGRGEDTAWVVWDRETPGFVSRFGRLEGIRNVPAPRQLELLPYGVVRATDPSSFGDEEVDRFQNIGADIRYGITANLALNATVQPDFGQVEADPATLNLSPFETFFEEKRPFFVEGSRFFQHPNFNLFYSRRIGTGEETARIRYAAKLTGKTAGGITLASLMASTDVTGEGQTHNLFKSGERASRYLVTRLGKEFQGGKHRVNLMQTAAWNSADRDVYGDRASREAYTTGLDFSMLFDDRHYQVAGSMVGSVVDPEPTHADPSYRPVKSYGTGGTLSFSKIGGTIRGGINGRWETDRLDLNDVGFLSAPDEISSYAWIRYNYNPDGKGGLLNRGNLELNGFGHWMYAARDGFDLHNGERVWSYGRGHIQNPSTHLSGWMQLRNFAEIWMGATFNPLGTQRYDTRNTVILADGSRRSIPGGGPLISEPRTYGGWIGGSTDTRKDLVFQLESNWFNDDARNASLNVDTGMRWNQSSAVHHDLSLGFNQRKDDTQHLANYENPGGGIGGVSYVYGDLRQKTVSLTLRTSLLFNRSQSLEIYAQPYLTVGNYLRARELVRADSYDLRAYSAEGFDIQDWDFRYAAVNLNAVYRYEYRPGSALFLVWTQSRNGYEQRGFFSEAGRFVPELDSEMLFRNEPENVFLAKMTYWFPI